MSTDAVTRAAEILAELDGFYTDAVEAGLLADSPDWWHPTMPPHVRSLARNHHLW